MRIRISIQIFFSAFIFTSCQQESVVDIPVRLEIPAHFPTPPIPSDNLLTEARVELGQRLFFDTRLSEDATISCAICHNPGLAFTDGEVTSKGVHDRTGKRNTPTLTNVLYNRSFMRDGGSKFLEAQVVVPLQSHTEMNLRLNEAVSKLSQDKKYQELAELGYNRPFDAFVLTRALAAFERTLVSSNSPYDHYNSGQEEALTDIEKKGMKLFFSKEMGCSNCHTGFNFTNERFENNGLYKTYKDSGRARITGKGEDIGKFRVPTLRNIESTAPYMHDGSVQSLELIIDHYAEGGKGHTNQSELITGFELDEQEREQLISFLLSLTDSTFVEQASLKLLN